MNKKWFTLQEANELLPMIKKELFKLKEIKTQFEHKYDELRNLRRLHSNKKTKDEDPFFEKECELEFLQMEAQTHIQNLYQQGVELKDIERGLVDFPAIRDGKEVLLCWKLGEEQISFYHDLESGFAGRMPLLEDGNE